jgi:hypothetical protein
LLLLEIAQTIPSSSRLERFDLHGDRSVRAEDRAGLERICRYLLRPPLAQERLTRLADGRARGTLARPSHDGTRPCSSPRTNLWNA